MEGFDHILNWTLRAGSHKFPGPDGGHRQLVGREQQCGLERPASRAISGRDGDAADLRPDLKGTGPGFPILGSANMIATKVEEVVDQIVG